MAARPIETRCAVVDATGQVVNLIIATPSDPVPDGCVLVEVMNGQDCDIGAVWDGSAFSLPGST